MRTKHAMICFRVEEPDFSDISEYEYDWETLYTLVIKDIPSKALEPHGNFFKMLNIVDAKLMHDIPKGCLVTGVLHLLNQIPIN